MTFLCSTFGQIAPSFAQGICLPFFGAEKSRSQKIKDIDSHLKPHLIEGWRLDSKPETLTKLTVRATPLKGYEGYALLTKDPSDPWGSRAANLPNNEDLQGSPVVNFVALGKYTSFALGFRAIDSNTMVVPMATTYSRDISRLSQELVTLGYEPIPFSFYSQQEVKLNEYAERFTRDFELPLASIQTPGHFIHDVSFHYSVLLLPPNYATALQLKAQLLSDVIAHLNSYMYDPKLAPVLKYVVRNISLLRAHIIDDGTADAGALVYFKNHPKHSHLSANSIKEFFSRVFVFSIPPEYISHNLRSRTELFNDQGFQYSTEVISINHIVKNYLARPQVRAKYAMISEPGAMKDTKTFEDAVLKRRKELEEASLEVLIKKSK